MGIACTTMIGSFITRELQTDSFHAHKHLIYALKADDPWSPGKKMFHTRYGSAEFMKENFSEVDDYCRINHAPVHKISVNNHDYFDEPIIIATSGNFFDFFSYQLLYNHPESVLKTPEDIVISEKLAKKYFGSNSAIGQVITFTDREKEEQMIVKGVFKKPLENTQINFDMVRLINNEYDSRCFIKLSEHARPDAVEKFFAEHNKSIPIIHAGTPGSYTLGSIQNTYFNTSRRSPVEASRNKTDLWIALVIGLMILGVAAFNYLGLVKNKLTDRSEEIMVRRINGGRDASLIMDFMVEYLLLVGISFIPGLLLTVWVMPFFNELVNTQLTINYLFQLNQILLLSGIAIALLMLTLAFIWVHLKSHKNRPVSSMGKKTKRNQLPAFNIFQLAATVILLIGCITIFKQINFISEKPIGMDKQVIEVKIPWEYADKVNVIKEELTQNVSIQQASVTTASPVSDYYRLLLFFEQNGEKKQYSPAGFIGDENYVETLGIEVIEGQGFSGNPINNQHKVLINQSLAQMFSDENLLGKSMPGMEEKTVVGIVKDFHYSSLNSLVEPAYISFGNEGRNILVKAKEGRVEEAKAAINHIWGNIVPNYPPSMETIGERYEWLHRNNRNYVKLIVACCSVSLFLSMVGLFVISFHSSRYRTKEIGVRKVNGAKNWEVMALLNKDFVKWVIISFIFATPIAWFVMNKWLQNFAYKTEMSWWIFALAGVLALGIALLTVSWQSWKAATRNPVEALRCE